MLRKVLVILAMVTISLGTLGGCKKSNEDKLKDAANDAAKTADKAAQDAQDALK